MVLKKQRKKTRDKELSIKKKNHKNKIEIIKTMLDRKGNKVLCQISSVHNAENRTSGTGEIFKYIIEENVTEVKIKTED